MVLKCGRLLALLLTAAGLVAGACRSTTLCANDACVQSGGAAGDVGVVGDRGGEAGSGNVPPEAAASGAAGQTAEAGAGGAGAPAGLACPDGFGDCDGSKLTGCEANLEWHNRNCGACGNRCEGGCRGRNCLEALRIGNVMLTSMVSTRTVAFALAAGQPDLLLKIGVSDGKMQELATVPWLSELALGSDLVYVWDPSHDESESGLMSIEFAGTRLRTEPLQRASSFGASEKGAYYIEEEDLEVHGLQRLWFRPPADAAWELLHGDLRSAELIASSSAGVVMHRYHSEDAQAKLYLLDGRDVIDYGVEPDGFDEAIATQRGITVLSSDSAQSRLTWLTASGDSKEYVLGGHPTGQGRRLVVEYGEVALTFSDSAATMVQRFNDNGLVRAPIGLPRSSELVFVDYHFMWHHAVDTSITPRLTRSTLFPIDP
jgi:hypothetical protein